MPRRRAVTAPLDLNIRVAGLLADMAAVQTARERTRAYDRAAAAIRDLEQPLDALAGVDGTLPRIPYVGPSSLRVIGEALDSGGASATVERAIDTSGRRDEIEGRRRLRGHFLSRAACARVLAEHGRYAGHRSDLQMHSTWSDGGQSLEDIAEGCLARGYTHAALTDHSAGLPIARGLTMERFSAQFDEIDTLNVRYAGRFRLLKGVEANIGADGAPDVALEHRRAFDVVVAALHSGLRTDDDQTPRLIAAIASPHVHVLGHPRGRKYGVRAGARADWPLVFHAAAEFGVAIELDGDPSRQDLDYELARLALDSGCLVALDSDAHATDELAYVDTAMAHARLAGIPDARVVNTWPLDRFLDWTTSRR